MKRKLLTVMLTASILTSFAQNTPTSTKVYHNEFGIDATGFIKQYLNFNQGQNTSNYTPTYYLTYRRHLKFGNIRFAAGGNFSNQDLAPSSNTDLNKYQSSSYTFNARLGWELKNDLSYRWQVYYGIDFRSSFLNSKNDANYWNAGYANGEETDTKIYGIAPILGFRFKLSSRLSLTTEANFSINWQETSSRKYYTPVSSQYAPTPDIVVPSLKKIATSFAQPLSIIITFDL